MWCTRGSSQEQSLQDCTRFVPIGAKQRAEWLLSPSLQHPPPVICSLSKGTFHVDVPVNMGGAARPASRPLSSGTDCVLRVSLALRAGAPPGPLSNRLNPVSEWPLTVSRLRHQPVEHK